MSDVMAERWTILVCDFCREPMDGATGHGHGTGRAHGGVRVEVVPLSRAEKAEFERDSWRRVAERLETEKQRGEGRCAGS